MPKPGLMNIDLHRIAGLLDAGFRRAMRGMAARIVAVVVVCIAATAGVTWAASQGVPDTGTVPGLTTAAPPLPLVVPNVRQEAFVFAKGTLEDDGFAWRVAGSVQGFAANTVVGQAPAAGTRVVDTGSPVITLTLARNGSYGQAGEPQDVSPYAATAVEPADLAGNPIGPAAVATKKHVKTTKTAKKKAATKTAAPAKTSTTATKTAAPAKTSTTATKTKTAKTAKSAKTPSTWPQSRPAAFTVTGGKKEPLDEMPLTDRALALGAWLTTHTKPTNANVKYWLYQNDWIVAGAKLGWWHGAQALDTLIGVDAHAQSLWQVGAKSEADATQALSYVKARSK
jgi:hypothetical protein